MKQVCGLGLDSLYITYMQIVLDCAQYQGQDI